MSAASKSVRLRVSPAVARIVSAKAPRDLQLAAAQGAISMRADDLVTTLMFLCQGADQLVRSRALRTLKDLPAHDLRSLAKDRETQPQLLHFLARARLHDVELMQTLLANPGVGEQTLALAARYANREVLSLLADNEQHLAMRPQLADLICANPAADQALRIRLGQGEKRTSACAEPKQEQGQERAGDDDQEEARAAVSSLDEAQEEPLEDDEIEELSRSKYQLALEMPVSEKIKMAMTGDKEWRTILLREANKMISSAVLKNLRITEGEVLSVARNRSANDELIRTITLNNEWLKNLEIKKALIVHPRTPLPKALRYMSVLTQKDLRYIAKSRNVSRVIVNNARRMLAAKEKKS